ncbi:MAG: caspase family protein, partial [Bacteroidales bacterium]|nr:caspase family protein [Bacteroidales bacterium]
GNLYFQSLTNKPKEDVIPVILDYSRDFEIETKIKLVKGDMEKAYGLQWGISKSPVKQYDFYLSGNGHYTIDKYTGEFHDFVPFTKSDKVNSYTYNKLTIRKVEDKYYFFLNENLVHSMPFEPFYGNLLGFQVAENSTILVDYITVSYISKAEVAEKSKVLIMDYNFATTSETVKKGLPVTLKLNLKNVGNKDAESLDIKYLLPENIDVVDFKSIKSLKQDEEQIISLQFFANENYTDTTIPVNLEILGADITNVNDLSLAVNIDQSITNEIDKVLAQNYSEFRGSNDPLKGLNVAQAMRTVQVGNYYALIIGIDNYSGEWQPLRNAVNDAKEIERVLKEKYFFTQFTTLFDEQASRNNILEQMEWLMQNSKEEDNVFIYYSGHGDYNNDMERGFWVPFDATTKSITKYISNEDIKSFLSGIRSKHTLLVADACFSGDIFRGKTMTIPYENSTKYYHKIYSLSSRKAMTSGGLEPVM